MRDRISTAKRVTWVGFFINLVLTVLKIIVGFLGRSTAMVADGFHSLSDFVTDLIVLFFIDYSGKDKDEKHKYGYGKYETFATLLISLILFFIGLGIMYSGIMESIKFIKGEEIQEPSIITLFAALISIAFKEYLYQYTLKEGKRINNQAIIANAWHHRTDAFSSIGTALGISGAIFLGEQWKILDPLAGILVSILIIKVANEIGLPSANELLERALPKEIENKIIEIVSSHPDVRFPHNLRTRKIGYLMAMDMHIKMDKNLSFVRAHDVVTEVEIELRKQFGEQTVISIHYEPLVEKP